MNRPTDRRWTNPSLTAMAAAVLAAIAFVGANLSAADNFKTSSKSDRNTTHTGEVVDVEGHEIFVLENGLDHAYLLNRGAKVTVNGAKSDIDAVKAGDKVTVTLEEPNSRVATTVAVTRRAGDQGADHPRPSAHDRSQANDSNSSSRNTSHNSHSDSADGDRPALGVIVGESHQGIEVTKVRPDSPAQKAGLREGDIVVKVADTEIATTDQFTDALHGKKPGDKVSIVIDRDGKEKTLSARLISRQQMLQTEEDHNQNNQMSSNDRFRNDQNRNGQFRNDQHNRFAGNRQPPPNRAWLGVRMQNGESEQQPEGVWVERVFPNGPAHRAGIQQGDEILAIDGQRVNSAEEVGEVLDQHEGEHRLSFEIVRNGNRRNLSVTLGNADDWEHHFYQSGYGNQEQQSGYANQEQFQGGYDQGNAMHQHATMMTDYMRHHGMQNQRLEERLDMLMNEVQQLRRQVHELQQNQNNNR